VTPVHGPRGLIIAAAASHSGKTTVSIGLISALRARGLRVRAAKCGPDYIDPRFLEAASGAPAINLDPWAMGRSVERRLAYHGADTDIVIAEGVMGLFDGGANGIGSTASLARSTGLPVLLVVGGQGVAQTAAAVADGCARLANDFSVIGAIANQIGSERHADLVREGFRRSSVPLLGLVRRDETIALPSRHLGLVQAEEHDDLARKIARAGELVRGGCDLQRIVESARPLPLPQGGSGLPPLRQRIAVARDVAFAFAYPHLLNDWRMRGAELSFFSPCADEGPSKNADAVFLPGGYPELHAARLAAASNFRTGMNAAKDRGALIYGECGGYMVLGENLADGEGIDHPMLGLLPVSTSFKHRALQLGYRRLRPLGDMPWATPLTAHEFHFARIVSEGDADRLFDAESADGAPLGPIGLRRDHVMGSFAHVIDAA
jgi:cobyrinic acid a,c-diamide synthase